MECCFDEYICRDNDGNIFISFDETDENMLSADPLLTHCLAVVKYKNDYLLGWNKRRARYEIFGGCIETGESARNCIIRECYEELGVSEPNITYLGAAKFLMMPDYFSSEKRIEIGGLYGIILPEQKLESLYDNIPDKNEIMNLALYSEIKGIKPIAAIDEALLKYFT